MNRKRLTWVITTLVCLTIIALFTNPFIAQSLPSTTTHAIDSFIQDEMRKNQIPGLSVGIVEGNEVIYLRGFGNASSDRQVTPQTSFIIGSMSKSFTALAVMQLVEAGQIELDVPVQRYIPWFRLADPEASSQITVRHLLNHNSGIPNIAGMRELVGTGEKTIEQVVRELNRYEFVDSPGLRFQYSNANFWAAGLS
jgi:CubicO group peptidase (beta-lactamase class C family)